MKEFLGRFKEHDQILYIYVSLYMYMSIGMSIYMYMHIYVHDVEYIIFLENFTLAFLLKTFKHLSSAPCCHL